MKDSKGCSKPTASQQGTYNPGTHRALNQYQGTKKIQSGTVKNIKR